jgi:hypothetical protein
MTASQQFNQLSFRLPFSQLLLSSCWIFCFVSQSVSTSGASRRFTYLGSHIVSQIEDTYFDESLQAGLFRQSYS